jgi:hypothetical protein
MIFDRLKNLVWVLALPVLALPLTVSAQTLPATITINSGVTVNSFVPISIFGNTTAYWISNTANQAVQPQVQAAGNYFLRYPGGSSSDDFHWNGTGSFNGNGYWVPNGTAYSPGFADFETYRGTTSSYGTASHLTDGNSATTWMSNVDTDFPNHQWVYIDLGATNITVSAVTIAWGNPHASSFVVQYYNGNNQPNSSPSESIWNNTSASTVTGAGGIQGVVFNPVAARYLRILMTAASGSVTANLGSVTVMGPAYAIAEIHAYNGNTLVSSNAGSSTSQSQGVVSSTDPASSLNYTTGPPGSTDFESYMTYIHKFSPNAIPMITVNFGTGTPSEAASWVYYANVTKGYGVQYWQIGNETEGTWETGGPIPTQDYVRRYIEYYDAMKAVDPTIIITGPVAGGFGDSSNMYDGNGAVHDFINILASKGKIDHLNAIDFHWYPNYGNYTAAAALASTSTLDAYPGQLNGWLSAAGVANPTTVPVLMSEFNVDPGDENFQVQLGNGLWVADALGRFITDFGSRGFTNIWDTLNGGSDHTSTTGGDLGYLDNTPSTYQPHASYWAMKMMTNDWAKPGDTARHQLISTSASPAASLFAAYSDYRPDGVFSLMVVNKNPTNPYNTWITGLPFTPNSSANEWIFSSANYAWQTATTPYNASPDTAPTSLTFNTGGGASFPVTFQPYSITVLQFTNSGLPTNTPTISPTPTITYTPTNTPTVTHTPNYGPATMVDDFEDQARNGPPRINLWGGGWYSYADTSGSTINVQYGVTPGASGSNYAVRLYGTMAASNEYSGYLSSLSPSGTTAYDLSGYGIIGLEFWVYGDGNTYRMMVDNQSVTDFDNYGIEITPPAGQWTFYQVPFSAMVTQGWGGQTGLPPVETGTDVNGVQFATQFGGKSYNILLDQIAFYTAAGVTPTSTFTTTPTWTPTDTPTPTSTLTFTPTGTWYTSTFTPTVTSTPTPTSTITPTFTATPANTLVLFPNPVKDGSPLGFYYNVTSPMDQVKVKVFTLAFRKVFEADDLLTTLGGHLYRLDWGVTGLNLANGLYYVVVYYQSGGSETHQVMKLLIQR